MAAILFDGVRKAFPNGHVAIDNLNLLIEAGQFCVLVGPSGCGKSTLLRLVAGLETASSGDIRINNTSMLGVDPARRDIAMVFQNYALYPHMTVHGNLSYGLKNRNISKVEIESRVQGAVSLLQLDGLLDRKPNQLSGGQRQRVAMGRAIVRDPVCFLFDEPLSNLDAKLRVDMRYEIKQLHQRLGRTTLYVTHDQAEAMTLADRLVVMNQGSIEQVGTPLEIYQSPQTIFVANFIGSPAMNWFNGTLTKEYLLDANGGVLAHVKGHEAADRSIKLGVRPEKIKLSPTSSQGEDYRFIADVAMIEEMGHSRVLHMIHHNNRWVVTVPVDVNVNLASYEFFVSVNDWHVFDAQTGQRIEGVQLS